jgi:hypothetical protein
MLSSAWIHLLWSDPSLAHLLNVLVQTASVLKRPLTREDNYPNHDL